MTLLFLLPLTSPVSISPGLFNSGNTCYLNSLLSTLYHIPFIRRNSPPPLSAIFSTLSASKPASTLSLTTLLNIDPRLQADADEFFKVLQSQILPSSINDLYTGTATEFIRPISPSAQEPASEKPVPFKDLSLPLTPNLERSLKERLTPEEISWRKTPSLKGDYLTGLPAMLQLTLQRFATSYNAARGVVTITKLDNSLAFPMTMNVNSTKYTLQSVVIHKGTFNYGHYYSYVNVGLGAGGEGESWIRCDDLVVNKVEVKDMQLDATNEGRKKKFRRDYGYGGRHAAAYLLNYVKVDEIPRLYREGEGEEEGRVEEEGRGDEL